MAGHKRLNMSYLKVGRLEISWSALLILSYVVYLFVGAAVFQALEKQAENDTRKQFQVDKLVFLRNYTCLDVEALERFVEVIMDAWEKGVNPSGNSTNPSNWDFSSSFFFAGTVITTIGYGNLSPSTISGQIFCVFYALFGIPLNVVFLNHLGKVLTVHLGRLDQRILTLVKHRQAIKILTNSIFLMSGTLLFLILPPVLFSFVEGWTYGQGFYYAFITLSTIGFGDYVIGTNPRNHYISIYRGLAALWIIFGLAWLAVLFTLGAGVVEKVIEMRRRRDSIEEDKTTEEDLDQSASQYSDYGGTGLTVAPQP
uniref:2P domain potassium channel Talk-1 n=1 Tax=Erpetoichthys calabaricus TaxID=27687 RepID=A0A8C4RK46_ERPCA